MRIAVIVSGIRFDSQRKIIDGLMSRAKVDGTDVFIFSCDSWSFYASEYGRGETEIYNLPDFTQFDGCIIHGDTINNDKVVERVVYKVREAGIPCVSLLIKFDGMINLGMENANGINRITTHLIKEHGVKRPAFISGPRGNHDGEGRLKAFRETMADCGLDFDERYVFYGDYHPESGHEAVTYFWGIEGEKPDAIVAANDEMALGAYYELTQMGIKVPDDVKLTGYDYTFSGRNNYPRITSVKRPEKELGQKAYERLAMWIKTGHVVEDEALLCWPVFTESCGCKNEIKEDNKLFRKRVIENQLHTITFSEVAKSSSAEFTGVKSMKELYDRIRKYVALINPEEIYFCMCQEETSSEADVVAELSDEVREGNLTEYREYSSIPLIYKNGKFSSFGEFETRDVLPMELLGEESGRMYTIVPLHHQERTFGYCVLGQSGLLMDSPWFNLFIMNINNALENVRKQEILNAMVERLNKLWIYDTLTGVHNRAGFFRIVPNIIREARERKQTIFALFLDLDGLKAVNDKYGHDEGDSYIKAMATVMNQVRRHGELLMRYGGDEFVVISRGYNDEMAQNYITAIEVGMENYNATSGHEYVLEASIGYRIIDSSEEFDIEELIEEADQEMYKVKKEKKKAMEETDKYGSVKVKMDALSSKNGLFSRLTEDLLKK